MLYVVMCSVYAVGMYLDCMCGLWNVLHIHMYVLCMCAVYMCKCVLCDLCSIHVCCVYV